MNKLRLLLLLLAILTVAGGAEKVVETSKLVNVDGLMYEWQAEEPFTGTAVFYHPNGQKAEETEYRDGKKNGKYILWFENGQKQIESEYLDGAEQGKTTIWHENGQKMVENNWRNGERQGKSIMWSEDGQILSEEEYDHGELINKKKPDNEKNSPNCEDMLKSLKNHDRDTGVKTVCLNKIIEHDGLRYEEDSKEPFTGKTVIFWPSSQMNEETEWRDGKADGKSTLWYENGQKEAEGYSQNGKLNGTFFMWHENGQKWIEEEYLNGKRHGKHIEWYKNGQKLAEAIYRDGELVSEKCWTMSGIPTTRKLLKGFW